MNMGRQKGFEPITLLGLLVTILLHGGGVAGILLYRRALEAAQVPPPPPSYVVAKLVALGKPRNPKLLPNKIIPKQSIAPEEVADYSADANDKPITEKKKEPDRDAVLGDKLQRSFNKAELLAEAQQEIEQEGSPDGVEGGTATQASDGDPYLTRIADLWNRTWSLPAIIPVAEAKGLFVLVVLRIDKDGTIQFPLQMNRSSGNAHFDNSITSAWQQIRQLPIPPPDRYASILAHGLKLRHTYRGLE